MTSSSSQTPKAAETAARVGPILGELKSRFKPPVLALKSAIAAYVHDGTLPPADAASTGLFDYPALRLVTDGVRREGQGHNLAFGRFEHAGEFVTTVTRPDLFEDYLRAQLMLLTRHYDVDLSVTRTGQQIPFPYVLDASDGSDMGKSEEHTSELQSLMPLSFSAFCLKKKNNIIYIPVRNPIVASILFQ